ncbi:MAG: flagellar assembly peptidoglycan hydrolase FlgJ [Gammaproteobacteria bacterium]|nr:flagellar assembly peptidoglycan hydrolase FlgJ [Gammaproteobacteria bacterium]MDH5652957.1 flagellar assembly peptidoglycan hydrolase FlgJ [Gammaproteobacteria bacterium]
MLKATPSYTYTDISGLNDLKRQARTDQQAALRDVARQFEGLFMKMMLKSMRDASFGDPIFDNNQSTFYRDMYDNQLALSLSQGKGLGLADVLARQLGQNLPVSTESADETSRALPPPITQPIAKPVSMPMPQDLMPKMTPQTFVPAQPAPQPNAQPVAPAIRAKKVVSATVPTQPRLGSVEKFVRTLRPMAEKAAEELNTTPEILLAQAALETGWGKHISKNSKGQSSHNLFNIKAGSDWDGKYIEKKTVEFKHGKAVTEVARFRAYDSYAESFKDYVDFLKSRKRYQEALESADKPVEYINELQKAGYATDPNYAKKVIRIMQREAPTFDKYGAVTEGKNRDV